MVLGIAIMSGDKALLLRIMTVSAVTANAIGLIANKSIEHDSIFVFTGVFVFDLVSFSTRFDLLPEVLPPSSDHAHGYQAHCQPDSCFRAFLHREIEHGV